MAYSRSGGEVGLACGDGAEGAPGVFGGHRGGEVGGRFVARFSLVVAPMHEEAIGQAGEDPMDADSIGRLEPALVIATRDIEPGVETGLDVPMAAVEREPVGSLQALEREAGEQGHGVGWLAFDFTAQTRGLGAQGKTGLLGADGCALENARFVAAFVAFPAAGARGAFRAVLALAGGVASARRWFREKRRAAVPGPGVRSGPALWAGCL